MLRSLSNCMPSPWERKRLVSKFNFHNLALLSQSVAHPTEVAPKNYLILAGEIYTYSLLNNERFPVRECPFQV